MTDLGRPVLGLSFVICHLSWPKTYRPLARKPPSTAFACTRARRYLRGRHIRRLHLNVESLAKPVLSNFLEQLSPRAIPMTRAPSSASASTVALPIPFEAPITSAVFPSTRHRAGLLALIGCSMPDHLAQSKPFVVPIAICGPLSYVAPVIFGLGPQVSDATAQCKRRGLS
jgi:hypothetical protein